ncbi:MAG: phosphatidate cytidylyltransferase [Burkholderiaceae bacterium]
MLRQRIVTAVVLLLVLLPALFYPSPEPFCALALVFIAAAAWEWARLAGYASVASLTVGALCALACGVAWQAGLLERPLPWLWTFAAALWVIGGGLMLRGGMSAWLRLPPPLRLAFGVLVLVMAWLALAQARFAGINFLLSILLLVWVADIFAYTAGRTWGGRFTKSKLAPSISPRKSWEGVWGAGAGVVLLALGWRWVDSALMVSTPSLYSVLGTRSVWIMVIAVIGLTAMSVVGDLVESLVKRAASVKDSSALLPGHGGVLDRIDALLPTLPLAMWLHALQAAS